MQMRDAKQRGMTSLDRKPVLRTEDDGTILEISCTPSLMSNVNEQNGLSVNEIKRIQITFDYEAYFQHSIDSTPTQIKNLLKSRVSGNIISSLAIESNLMKVYSDGSVNVTDLNCMDRFNQIISDATRRHLSQQNFSFYLGWDRSPDDEVDDENDSCEASIPNDVPSTSFCVPISGYVTAEVPKNFTALDDYEIEIQVLQVIKEKMSNGAFNAPPDVPALTFIGLREAAGDPGKNGRFNGGIDNSTGVPDLINDGEESSNKGISDFGISFIFFLALSTFLVIILGIFGFRKRRNFRKAKESGKFESTEDINENKDGELQLHEDINDNISDKKLTNHGDIQIEIKGTSSDDATYEPVTSRPNDKYSIQNDLKKEGSSKENMISYNQNHHYVMESTYQDSIELVDIEIEGADFPFSSSSLPKKNRVDLDRNDLTKNCNNVTETQDRYLMIKEVVSEEDKLKTQQKPVDLNII